MLGDFRKKNSYKKIFSHYENAPNQFKKSRAAD